MNINNKTLKFRYFYIHFNIIYYYIINKRFIYINIKLLYYNFNKGIKFD